MANKFLNGISVLSSAIIDGSSLANGSSVLDVQGTQGQLFSVTDSLTGDLFSVSDISGVPILNVNSDGTTTLDGDLTQTSGNATFAGTVAWGNSTGLLTYGSDRAIFRAASNKALELQTNGGTTLMSGIGANAAFAGNIALGDGKLLKFGASDDYQIYHNSTTNVNHIFSDLDRQLSINANIIQLTNQANSTTYLKLESSGATFAGDVTVGADADGHDVLFYGNATGEKMLWDKSESKLRIYHDTGDTGLEIFTVGSSTPNSPQFKVGRDAAQYFAIYTTDRDTFLIHRQDETDGQMRTNFDQWDSNTTDPSGEWRWRSGDGTGASMTTALTLSKAGNATFAGDVSVGDDLTVTDDATVGGTVNIGTTTPSYNTNYGTGDLNVENDTFASAQIFTHNDTAGNFSFLGLGKSSGTGASPTIVQANERIAVLGFYGYDGAAYKRLAGIDAYVDGTPGTNDMPGKLLFNTTADGSSSPTTRLTIGADGDATFAGDVLVEDNLYLTDAGTVRGKIQLNSSDRDNLDIKATSLGSLMRFYTVDTLALTLNASQNATFAGKILAGLGTTAAATINAYTATVSTDLYSALRIIDNTAASSYWDIGAVGGGTPDLKFFANAGTAPKFTLSNAGNATFAGNVTLNSRLTFDYGGDHYLQAGTDSLAYKSSGGTVIMSLNASTKVATFSGDVTVAGNLTVGGTTTTLNTQTVEVKDNILQLNTTQGSPNTMTASTSGISVFRGLDTNGNDTITQASLIFDEGDDTWDLTNNLKVAGNTSVLGTFEVSGIPLNTDSTFALVADEVLGSQLIPNGNFATNSNWNLGQGQWTITSGAAVASNAGNILHTAAAVASSNGIVHKVTFTLSDVTDGYVRVGLSTLATAQYNTNGTYTVYFESSGNNYLYFHPYGFTGKVSNVSTYEVINNQIQKRELGTGAFGPTPVGAYLPLTAGSGSPLTGDLYIDQDSLYLLNASNNYWRVQNNSSGKLVFKQGTTQRGIWSSGELQLANNLIVDNKIGVGTTSPQAFTKVDVRSGYANGNAAIAAYGYNGVGGFAILGHAYAVDNTDAGSATGLRGISNGGRTVSGSVNIGGYFTAAGSESNYALITDSGNVGIGISSPEEQLDVAGNIKITDALLSNQENTDIDTGAEVVAQVAHATYTAAFFDFVVKKGTNVRSGTVYACHDGDTAPLVEFTETSTQDLGDTSDVVLSVDISGGYMRLLATVASDDWSVKSLIRAI